MLGACLIRIALRSSRLLVSCDSTAALAKLGLKAPSGSTKKRKAWLYKLMVSGREVAGVARLRGVLTAVMVAVGYVNAAEEEEEEVDEGEDMDDDAIKDLSLEKLVGKQARGGGREGGRGLNNGWCGVVGTCVLTVCAPLLLVTGG